jgi:hypothetical protein
MTSPKVQGDKNNAQTRQKPESKKGKEKQNVTTNFNVISNSGIKKRNT